MELAVMLPASRIFCMGCAQDVDIMATGTQALTQVHILVMCMEHSRHHYSNVSCDSLQLLDKLRPALPALISKAVQSC